MANRIQEITLIGQDRYSSGVYRIHDRFLISGRGPVYILDYGLYSAIELGDILYDSKGSRFKAIGKERFTRCFIDPTGNYPEGVLFEIMDGKEVQGGVMIKDPSMVLIPSDITIMDDDPLPYLGVEGMWKEVDKIRSMQELIDEYAAVHNKFWFMENNINNYEENTEECRRVCRECGEWAEIMNTLFHRVMEEGDKEGFLYDFQPEKRYIKQLTRIMGMFGFGDVSGWWLVCENKKNT